MTLDLHAIFYGEAPSSWTTGLYLPEPRVEDRQGRMFSSEGQDKGREFTENSDLGQSPSDSVELAFHLHSLFCEPNPALCSHQFQKDVLCVTGPENWLILGPEAQNQTGN